MSMKLMVLMISIAIVVCVLAGGLGAWRDNLEVGVNVSTGEWLIPNEIATSNINNQCESVDTENEQPTISINSNEFELLGTYEQSHLSAIQNEGDISGADNQQQSFKIDGERQRISTDDTETPLKTHNEEQPSEGHSED